MECTFPTEEFKSFLLYNKLFPIPLSRPILLFLFFVTSVSYSQEIHTWFGRKHGVYIAAGYSGGKRIVSGIDIYPKDSINQQIRVELEVLIDWVKVDSAVFDLFLDTTMHELITVDNREFESIQYRSKGGEIIINFDKPQISVYRLENGKEWVSWSLNHAVITYASDSRFKKYQKVLKAYYEK